MEKGYTREVSKVKKIMVVSAIVFLDIFSFAISYYIVEPIFKVSINELTLYIFNYIVCTILPTLFLFIFGAYKFKNLKNFLRLIYLSVFSLILSFLSIVLFDFLLFRFASLRYLLYFFLSSFACAIFLRLIYYFTYLYVIRYMRKKDDEYSPTIIIGAGFTGRSVYNEIYNYNSRLVPICFVDDDEEKIGTVIQGIRVLGPTVIIPEIVKKYDVKSIVFAIPSSSDEDKNRILKYCADTHCEISVIPSGEQILNKKRLLSPITKIDVKQLIGRSEIGLDDNGVREEISNKTCLVTGAGGSIGSELCRQIAKYNAENIVLLDINENSVFEIQQELLLSGIDASRIQVEVSSVRDYEKLEKLFIKYNFDFVFHSAAHKHVPLMERAPEEAIKNNCIATYNLARLCDKYNVSKMIFVSTDKAGHPDNIMAASKRVSEILLKYYNNISKCEYKSVRFGNVLGSNGSVIQLFLKQIENGGPVTVTHPEILRYFMTIPESVALILKVMSINGSNNIFALDMGKPVKILTLAENLIAMCGLEPYADVDIKFTGLRPGETLNEKPHIVETFIKTNIDKVYEVNFIDTDYDKFLLDFNKLIDAAHKNNTTEILSILDKII